MNEKKKMLEKLKFFSNDPRTKVSSILIDYNFNNLSFGVNNFPSGIENNEKRWSREEKGKYVIHSEINCILEAMKKKNNLINCILITSKYPCHECFKIIIQTGIKFIYTFKPETIDEKWNKSYEITNEMLKESNIKIYFLD